MKTRTTLLASSLLLVTLFVFLAMSTAAAVRYVDVNSVSPTPPYTNWATAATIIQDAIDVAVAGDEIVVTNGVYQTGGQAVYGTMTNRVAVTKPLTVRSVNGPEVTVIRGYQVPGTTNGDGAVRCVYLAEGAALSGFTLTNGATRSSGDYVLEGGGGGVWCWSVGAVVSNCVLSGNSAEHGGGAYAGTLNNCTLTGNSADYDGGGAIGGTLNNCTLTGNSAGFGGGGATYAMLNNCTLTDNSANYGGGAHEGTLNNCIVYFNSARYEANYDAFTTLNYCCTTPLPINGLGNLTAEPQLASASHLSAGSPCRGAGSLAYVSGRDIDGEPWASPPSIGCDEVHPGAEIGPLSVVLRSSFSNVATGFEVSFTAQIMGYASANRWEFGDGTVLSNRLAPTHAWSAPGDYPVVVRAYNLGYPASVSATVTVQVAFQPVHYVAAGNSSPLAPYLTWATAATNIQDAVDTAFAGGTILVSNGVYQTGGRAVDGTMTNRVAVTKPLTVRSVNGPEVTVIRGYQVPGTTNGDAAVRCVYLTNGAALVGFMLTNGATRSSGDYGFEGGGGGVWCESASAVVSNCSLAGNSAYGRGGGASDGTLNSCTVTGNSAGAGGGVSGSTLNNCTLGGNSAFDSGGGASSGTLNSCTLTGNLAYYEGGGASDSTLNNCTLSGNSAYSNGGGAAYATLNNCTLTGNSAGGSGGGAYAATLNNCTLTGNSAGEGGGAAGQPPRFPRQFFVFCILNNCVVYYNTADWGGANYGVYSSLNYCCSTPLPPDGVGNITAEPQLTDVAHLSMTSPCRRAGTAAYTSGLDIDGELWANPPSIGCDEFYAGPTTGSLSVAIASDYTNVIVGFTVNLTASLGGRASANRWEFGDGIIVSNRPFATSHSWGTPGDYPVVFRAYNDSIPTGVGATLIMHVVDQPVSYVALGGVNPVAPYSSWATAATNIQDAVDTAYAGGTVLVSNGVYRTGGRMVDGATTNRVTVTKPLTVRSVNGPAVTVIEGYRVPGTTNGDSAVRCVYLAEGAALMGFTLTNGSTRWGGGGVWCASAGAVVSNCVISGNSAGEGGGASGGTLNNCTLAGNSADLGGGAVSSTLNSCILTGNSARYYGGGASYGTLNNCTLTGNSASSGGGGSACSLENCTITGNSASSGGGVYVYFGTLNNCIVYFNNAPNGANYDRVAGILNYCCTTPLPTDGVGNFTSAPLFVNQLGGNFRLQANSPCINAGRNAYAPAGLDLVGNPRIAGGTVDVGAYEFQSPQSALSYAWLQQYGLPTSGSVDFTDGDGDGFNNWQEWRTGTVPTNALSVLRLLSPKPGAPGVIVSWPSVTGRNYFLERGTNLGAQPPFLPLATDIPGQTGTTSYLDTNAVGAGPFFYRVGVGNEP